MSEVNDTLQSSLIFERDDLKNDFFDNRGMDVLVSLSKGDKTIDMIARELNIPAFNVKLFIHRLMSKNIVKLSNEKVINGKLYNTYSLVSRDLNVFGNSSNKEDEIESAVTYFSNLISDMVRNSTKDADVFNAKICHIKCSKDRIMEFRKDLDKLYEKYNSIEDMDEADMYGFLSVIAKK